MLLLLLNAEAAEAPVVITEYIRWTGKIHLIQPEAGENGRRVVHVAAHDIMQDLAESGVRSVPRQIDEDEVTLFEAVLDALPASSQPTTVDFDAALYTFPVAFDDIGDGAQALDLVERVASSTRGYVFPLGDDTLRYQNQAIRALQSTEHAFVDTELLGIDVPSSRDNVFNLVRITRHPKLIPATTIVLYAHTGEVSVPAGATVEPWGSYFNPLNPQEQIGGTDFVVPDDGVDWIANANEDGSGADLTSQVTVTAEGFAAAVKFTITNTSGVTAYLTTLQFRGRGIYDQSPVTAEASSVQPYGNREINIDQPYASATDFDEFKAQAEYIEITHRELADQVNQITFALEDSDALMEQGLEREIGDVITASETLTLPTPVSAYIQWLELEIHHVRTICRFGLAPRIIEDEVGPVDEVTCLESLAAPVAAAPESRIGFAVVGFSEIAA